MKISCKTSCSFKNQEKNTHTHTQHTEKRKRKSSKDKKKAHCTLHTALPANEVWVKVYSKTTWLQQWILILR